MELDPSILRDFIMSEQSGANYMGICANIPELRSKLEPQSLDGPSRHYALQHFVYMAPRLSKAQMKDLLEDDQLPWASSQVTRAVSEWAKEKWDEEYEFLCPDREVALLNICWTDEFDVCGKRVVVPGVIPSKESDVPLRGEVTHLCTWGEGHLVLRYRHEPTQIVLHDGERAQYMAQPLANLVINHEYTCMAVHGDLLYVGTSLAYVFAFDLKTRAVLSNWNERGVISDMLTMSFSQEGDMLWVGHESGCVTVWRRHDGTYLGLGSGSPEWRPLSVEAWKNGMAFTVCDDETRVRVWNATQAVQHVQSIDLPAAGKALAVLMTTILCVADNAGGIHAYDLKSPLERTPPLWTLASPTFYSCVCLVTRGEQLLYVGTSSSSEQVLEVVNADGIAEHELHVSDGIAQLVNFKHGVYIRRTSGHITVMLA